jgi:methionyl-tRNA formyltransferase
MNVVVFGKGKLAIDVCQILLQNTQYKLHAVPVIPEPKWTSSLVSWCEKRGVPYTHSGKYRDLSFKVDLGISVFYDKIFKKDFIESCGKLINIHNGPLPKYRGMSPINWALKDNRQEHGITIHEITPGIDDGPIISQLNYSIYPEFDEVIDVYNRSLEYGKVLFANTLPLLEKITPRVQDETQVIYHDSTEHHLLGERSNFTKKASVTIGDQP